VWQGSPADPLLYVDYQDEATKFTDAGSLGAISSSGQFAYDSTLNRLYVSVVTHPLGSNANDATFIVEYTIKSATESGYYFDEYIDGTIIKLPVFKQSFADQMFGYLPVETSSIIISNANNELNVHLYDTIWKNTTFYMYQYFNNEPRQVMSGLVENISIDDNVINFSVKSYLDYLDKDYKLEKFREASFGGTKTEDQDKYIRKVFGRVTGFVPINYQYSSTISTTTNRHWVISKDPLASHPTLTSAIDTGYANTTTTRKVADASGFNNGDRIIVKVLGTYEHTFISGVNYTTNVITFQFPVSSGSSASGDDVRRGFIGNLTITNGAVTYVLRYLSDWVEVNHDGHAGFTLTNNFEAFHLMTPFDPDTMQIACTVYGVKNVPVFQSSNPLGTVSERGGAYSNPVGILMSVMADSGEILPLIDETTFTAEFAARDDYIGFAVPETSDGSLPKYRDVVVKILNSFLGRVYIGDTAGGPRFMVNRIAPTAVTADYVLGVDELRQPRWDFNYNDAPYRLDVRFANQEYGQSHAGSTITPSGLLSYNFTSNDSYLAVFRNGDQARWAFNTRNYLQFDTYLDLDYTQDSVDQIEDFADKLRSILCERRGTLTVGVKNRFFSANIGDTIEIQRESLPGFEYIFGTAQSRKFIMVEKNQSLDDFTIVLDDQLGIENSGVW
jgi:hypothetical protein